jgi:hypothetical protein
MTITNMQISPANFISATNEIRLRVLGAGGGSKSFTCSGDQVQFVVETSGGSISRAVFGNECVLAKVIPSLFRLYEHPPFISTKGFALKRQSD